MSLLSSHGYWVVLVGAALEGETVLIMGGMAAHQGLLHLPLVIGAAFLGSLIGDQVCYWIGRRHGRAFLERHPHWQPRAEQANRLLTRYGTAFTIGFRFLYGLRTVSPFVIGAAGMPPWQFTLLNTCGAAVWAMAGAALGYAFGGMAATLIEGIQRNEARFVAVLAGAGILFWLLRRFTRLRHRPGPRP
ncbi:MAG: DedA family protein [Candidatus Sericytochromatia bacterium]|nr:DedA family protein [Candidatus Sericytochromatia bacterium]